MKTKIPLSIENNEEIVLLSQGESILEALLRERKNIGHSCGGFGTCGTCQVQILEGLENLPERNEVEADMAADRSFAKHERLACQTTPRSSVKIRIP
jgi:2Fe-2S ferredoxin